MIRAGNLDRTIIIERATEAVSPSGAVTSTFTPIATMRAQLVSISTVDIMRNAGGLSEQASVFRTRWLDGVTVADRVGYLGMPLTIKAVREIGRREGLELTCEVLT